VIRKRQYGLDGEIALSKATGYSEDEMYINDIDAGDRVLLLDDVVDTGGTLRGITGALEETGAEVVDVVAVIKRVSDENRLADTDYEAKTLVDVDVESGDVVLVNENGSG
jgi:adenine phosphoribosyltransferase